MSLKQERLASLIHRHISDIINNELKNNKVGMVTITRVKVSDDHSWANVYVSFLNKDKVDGVKALENAKGFIRSSLAKKITTRRVPDIVFTIDNSFEEGQKISDLINKANKE